MYPWMQQSAWGARLVPRDMSEHGCGCAGLVASKKTRVRKDVLEQPVLGRPALTPAQEDIVSSCGVRTTSHAARAPEGGLLPMRETPRGSVDSVVNLGNVACLTRPPHCVDLLRADHDSAPARELAVFVHNLEARPLRRSHISTTSAGRPQRSDPPTDAQPILHTSAASWSGVRRSSVSAHNLTLGTATYWTPAASPFGGHAGWSGLRA